MQNSRLNVTGMTCGGCANKVTQVLSSIKGVEEVDVNLSGGLVSIKFNEKLTNPTIFKEAIHAAGYGVSPSDSQSDNRGCCG